MPNIIKDFYKLGQSDTKVLTGLAEEIRIDLNLQENKDVHGGIIVGQCTDSDGKGLSGVVIKIMGSDYTPLAHTITNEEGNYAFPPFPSGTGYRIFASVVGHKLATLDQFSLLNDQSVTKNFKMEVDLQSTKSFIAGDVFDSSKKPVGGANVNLFQIQKDSQTLIASCFTNEFGQYVFRALEMGDYKVTITGLGYLEMAATVSITANSSIAKVVSSLIIDARSSKGTISGIITDNHNQPVEDADVVLYRVEEDESLTPIALTKTIAGGVYLFVNTVQGKYKIKSNKSWIDA